MANPQPDKYTKISNELLENIPKFKFNGIQLRILMVVWRYTYGFNRKEHEMSTSFIADAVGADVRRVKREIANLIKLEVITIVKNATFSSARVLAFNKNYDRWGLKRHQGAEKTPGDKCTPPQGAKKTPPPGGEFAPQERQYSKDNIKDSTPLTPHKKIVDLYNKTCQSLPRAEQITGSRKKLMRSRWKQYNTLDIFKKLFKKAEASDFLSGRNGRWTSCNFDWLLKESNMVKVLEGIYDNERGGNGGANRGENIENPGKGPGKYAHLYT